MAERPNGRRPSASCRIIGSARRGVIAALRWLSPVCLLLASVGAREYTSTAGLLTGRKKAEREAALTHSTSRSAGKRSIGTEPCSLAGHRLPRAACCGGAGSGNYYKPLDATILRCVLCNAARRSWKTRRRPADTRVRVASSAYFRGANCARWPLRRSNGASCCTCIQRQGLDRVVADVSPGGERTTSLARALAAAARIMGSARPVRAVLVHANGCRMRSSASSCRVGHRRDRRPRCPDRNGRAGWQSASDGAVLESNEGVC